MRRWPSEVAVSRIFPNRPAFRVTSKQTLRSSFQKSQVERFAWVHNKCVAFTRQGAPETPSRFATTVREKRSVASGAGRVLELLLACVRPGCQTHNDSQRGQSQCRASARIWPAGSKSPTGPNSPRIGDIQGSPVVTGNQSQATSYTLWFYVSIALALSRAVSLAFNLQKRKSRP